MYRQSLAQGPRGVPSAIDAGDMCRHAGRQSSGTPQQL